MLRNTKTKLFLVIFLIITFITTFSYAENETTTETIETTTDNAAVVETETTDESTTQATSTQDIYEGDLYLTGENITMDKLVNGNTYITGNNVTITGQIAGNLFVFANQVTFTDAYIESSVYIFANEVKFQAVASDLYACCNKLEIPSDYGVYRDLNCYSNSLSILGIIGRNVNCNVTALTLEKDGAKASIYGDLAYSSASEIQIPEGSVQGETKFSKIINDSNKFGNITDYLFEAACAIIFTLVIYGLGLLFTKSSIEKCTKITSKKFLPAFGIGILALILVPIISILLMISMIGLPIAAALLIFFGLLLCLGTSIFAISIANIICNKFNISNKWLKALGVVIVSLLVYIIGIIPYVSILKFLIIIFGFGTIIMNIFFKNINFEKTSKKENK